MTNVQENVKVRPQGVSSMPAESSKAGHGKPRRGFVRYLAEMSGGRYVLWCYFIYWIVIAARNFDPSPRIWLTSLALSLIVGIALYLNAARSGAVTVRLGRWPTFRLFLTPFCVSSFSALVKERSFVLIFSPNAFDTLLTVGICLLFACLMGVARVVLRMGAPITNARKL